MQFLLIFRRKPAVADDDWRSLSAAEKAEAWTLMREGVLRSLWYLPPLPSDTGVPGGSVCTLECVDETEARRRADRFPPVRHGFVDVELLRLDPFDGFDHAGSGSEAG